MSTPFRNLIRFLYKRMNTDKGLLTLPANLNSHSYRKSDDLIYTDVKSLETKSPIEESLYKSTTTNIKSHIQSLPASRPVVPHDKNNLQLVKKFVFAMCQEYLGGVWKRIDIDEFNITKPNGGLSNHLYICEIKKNDIQPIRNEPMKIFVRLYGENHQMNSNVLIKDIIVSTILSDFQIGPKLYGIFPAGRLEELINASPMNLKDMYLPEYSAQIAEIMAQFHTLEMPFVKKPYWLNDTTSNYIREIDQHRFTNEHDIERFNTLSSFNLRKEFTDLMSVLESLNPLVVFCHNDINVGNVLKLENKLMIIDYEYGSYNYRGYDIGNLFCEMMFDNNVSTYPYFKYNFQDYPSESQQLHFLRRYIKKFRELAEQKNLQCHNLNEQEILVEANYCALASSLFWIFWSLCQASTSTINFDYMDYALARADAYFKHKKIFFPNGYEGFVKC